MKKSKNKIIFIGVFCVLLAVSFFYGNNFSKKENNIQEPAVSVENFEKHEEKEINNKENNVSEKKEKNENFEEENKKNTEKEKQTKENTENNTQKTQIEENKDDNASPKKEKEQEKLTCTLSVSCNSILTDISRLSTEKHSLVPKNGIIYKEKEVVFFEGESVFNVLLREMKQNKIHLEFTNVPVFKSAYIEGIGNLYEFDCGDLSGWMYKVNGEFPNYGCSQYKVKKGDKIEWVYTCDLGKDVGGEYSAKNGNVS